MGEEDFYMWNIKKSQSKLTLYVILLIIGVLLLISYPAWPYPIKLGIFYVLFYFLLVLISIISVRLVLFLFVFIFGRDFYIFPNMFDDHLGIIDSFKPFYSFSVRKSDGIWLIIGRIFLFLMFALTIFHYTTAGLPIEEFSSLLTDSFDWGKNKVVGNNT